MGREETGRGLGRDIGLGIENGLGQAYGLSFSYGLVGANSYIYYTINSSGSVWFYFFLFFKIVN